MFILNEVNKKDTDFVLEVIRSSGIKAEIFSDIINEEIKKGTIKATTDFRYLFINTLALSVFPFIARPLTEVIVFNDDKKEYDKFLKQRKTEVTEIIFTMIKP